MKSYLEYKDSKSEKFWEVSVKGKVMTTRWGKLETAGQSKSKELESPALAASEAEKQKASKVKKGYREVAGKKKTVARETGAAKKAPIKNKALPKHKARAVAKVKVDAVLDPKTATKAKLTAWVKEDGRTASDLSKAAERFPEVDRVMASRSDTPSKLLTKLSHSSDRSTRSKVTANTNTPTADYVRLGQQFPKEFLANPVLDLLLLENPGLLSELPAALLTRIAKTESCPETFLVWASSHSVEKVQLAVAMNAKAPTAALDTLQASVFKKVRTSLLPMEGAFEGDPEAAFREKVREWLASLSAEDAFEAWDKKDIGLAQFTHLSVSVRLARAFFANIHDWRRQDPMYKFGVNTTRIKIAGNPKTPPAILSALARDDLYEVRAQTARNPRAPAKALKILAKDKEEYVRRGVRRNFAENPNTPVALLEALAKDKDAWVRSNVAENPNTPVSTTPAPALKEKEVKVLLGDDEITGLPDTSILAWIKLLSSFHLADNKSLTKASRSKEWLDRFAAALHPDATKGILDLLINDADEDVAAVATEKLSAMLDS